MRERADPGGRDGRGAGAGARRRLLDLMAGAEGVTAPDAPTPRSDAGPVPLSSSQERLWFLEQLQPGTSTFNVPAVWPLATAIDEVALERSLVEIAGRHEILRTRYRMEDGRPLQEVVAEPHVPFAVVDLRHLDPEARDAEVDREIGRAASTPFDLEAGPPLRARLIRISWTRNVLVVVVHHIAADGWSLGLLYRELVELYDAFSDGRPAPLAPLALQYADYAAWQRRWLQGPEAARQLAYWAEHLRAVSPLELPADRPRPVTQDPAGAYQSARLGADGAERLEQLCHAEGTTPFMVLLAAYVAVLHRYTGAGDIAVGTPIAGRRHQDVEPLIGFFLNTLVLRVAVASSTTFRELVQRVRAACVAAYDNQDVPFEAVLETLKIPRDLGRTPLFQAYFNLLNYDDRGAPQDHPALDHGRPRATTARFDLSVYASPRPDDVDLTLVYSTALFNDDTAEAILSTLTVLLDHGLREPAAEIGALAVWPPTCTRPSAAPPVALREGSDPLAFPAESAGTSVGARFEEVARATPEGEAIATDDESWIYARLEEDSRAIAGRLAPLSAERVALLCDDGAEAVTAMLGVLRAGRAFVPLDPHAPPARNRAVLAATGAGAILTDRPLAADEAWAGEVTVLRRPHGSDGPPPAWADRGRPGDVAYLLATSGSTGRPKLVAQTQRNLLRHIRTYAANLAIAPGDRLTLLPAYTFDAALMDIFGALLTGACLVPFDLRGDGLVETARRLRAARPTVVHATPTVFRAIVPALDAPLGGVKAMVLGGEAVFPSDLALFAEAFLPPCVLVNGYGPTEATVCAQHFTDGSAASSSRRTARPAVPIGYPVEGVELVVTDHAGNEAPPHAPGELVVRSRAVALGYWDEPALTEATFTTLGPGPDPVREYRTGDRARRLLDHSLVFEGRNDTQVKVLGHRVELTEIESALLDVPGVREAAVVAPGTARHVLVAYLTSAWPVHPRASDVRRRLRLTLPDYMVPSAIVWLDELPRLATGKLDRSRLPEPDAPDPGDPAPPATELTATGRRVVEVVAELLGVPAVDPAHDFFAELGGHSLLAMRLVARIEGRFGVKVPLRTFFETPTAAALAAAVDRATDTEEARRPAPAIAPRRARQVRVEPGGRLVIVGDAAGPDPAGKGAPAEGDGDAG